MAKPTTSAVTMEGAMISSRVRMAVRAKSSVSTGVMCSYSNRHGHDGLIGGDDLVAHRNHSIESQLRRIHRIDHIDDIGLAGDLGGGGLFALADGIDRVFDRASEKIGKAGAGRGGSGRGGGGGAGHIGDGLVGGGGGGGKSHDLSFRWIPVRTRSLLSLRT